MLGGLLVLGLTYLAYDLWGPVVNTANRMESQGIAGRIQVTDTVRQQLNEPFILAERGVIDIKGKGEMLTWFLNGRSEVMGTLSHKDKLLTTPLII